MCTVSAAYGANGHALRVVINRDERWRRMAARPPALTTVNGIDAAWPVDQQAGGTWAAVTGRGIAFALLNLSAPPAASVAPVSRGAIIPWLAGSGDLDEVIDRFASGPARWACAPFKLLAVTLDRSVVLTRDGVADVEVPFVLATSSLGDTLVSEPRRALFDELLMTSDSTWHAQDRLHRHAWPDRRHVSVLMSRPDAGTVSRTEIILMRDRSEMRYAAILNGWPAAVATPTIHVGHRRATAAA